MENLGDLGKLIWILGLEEERIHEVKNDSKKNGLYVARKTKE